MAHRAGRLVLIAVVAGATIVTQAIVSASTSTIEQIDRTDSMLAELTQTVNGISTSLRGLVGVRDAELRELVRAFDDAFDRSLARLTSPAGLDLTSIDLERRAFVDTLDTPLTRETSLYAATGVRAFDLQALKLAGAILAQREIIELTKAQVLHRAEMMVALSCISALLMIAYLVWRPLIAARTAQAHPGWVSPLFARH
jgi:hypothetical protein